MVVTELVGGHSGARIFRADYEGEIFCLKIPHYSVTERSLQKVREICQIYHDAKIPALELLGYGKILDSSQIFFVFDYLAGEDYKTFSNQHCSLAEIHQAGTKIGRYAKRLKTYPAKNLKHIPTENISDLVKLGNQLYQNLLQENSTHDLLRQYFAQSKLDQLMQKFNQTEKVFAKLTPHLIHGDIKRSNVIISQDDKLSLIDLASMKNSYDVLNFRYQMTWALLPENTKKREFVRGYFDGLYDGKRPKDFRTQVAFVTMLNFLEHTVKFSHDQNELNWYFAKMQPVFNSLLKYGIMI